MMVKTKDQIRKIKKGMSPVPMHNPMNPMRSIPIGEHGPAQPGDKPKNKLQFVSQEMVPVVQLLQEILDELKKINQKS